MILTQIDKDLAESVEFLIGTNTFFNKQDPGQGKVSFQFPPKILSDSRSADWKGQGEGVLGMEPLKVFTAAGERTFSLTWSYIVDNKPGSQWDAEQIKLEVNRIRGYFSNLINSDKDFGPNLLIVYLKYPLYTGPKMWTCRITSVDVKYSDCLVVVPKRSLLGGLDINTSDFARTRQVHPLRTDITADMRLWVYPRLNNNQALAEDIESRSLLLKPNPTFQDLWY
jgi:hypothetical protein